MKIKDAIKEVNSDIINFISKFKPKLVLQIVVMFILVVGAIGGGFASIIWTGMAIFMDSSRLPENFNELLVTAYIVSVVSGYSLLVGFKISEEN